MSADPYDNIEETLAAAHGHTAAMPPVTDTRVCLALACLHQALADLVALTKRQHPYYAGGEGKQANVPDSRRQPGESDEGYILRVRGGSDIPASAGPPQDRVAQIVSLEAQVKRLIAALAESNETNSRLRRELGDSAAKYLGLHDLIVGAAERARALVRNKPEGYTTPESAPREGAPSEE